MKVSVSGRKIATPVPGYVKKKLYRRAYFALRILGCRRGGEFLFFALKPSRSVIDYK
jgi:hypothetical protein